jgi:hypothetical protein
MAASATSSWAGGHRDDHRVDPVEQRVQRRLHGDAQLLAPPPPPAEAFVSYTPPNRRPALPLRIRA